VLQRYLPSRQNSDNTISSLNLFITYFNIELKRTKLTSHTDTKLMDMSDWYRLRVLLLKRQQIFPRWTYIRKHQKCYSDICHRDKTLITRYQASREPHDVTSAQLLIVVWKMSTFSEERFEIRLQTFDCHCKSIEEENI
jgi:hypothetical protein